MPSFAPYLASWVGAAPAADFQTLVLLIVQFAGPPILAWFLFVQERRVHADYEKSSPEEREHHRRIHTSTVTLTYLLIAVCVGVWLFNLFGQTPYVEGQFFGLTEQSAGVVDQVEPVLPGDAKFYLRKRAPENGGTAYSVSWIADAGLGTIRFTFQRQFAAAAAPATDMGSPVLRGDSTVEVQPAAPRPPITRSFSIDLAGLGFSPKQGIRVRYKADPAPGHFLIRTPSGERTIAWDDEVEQPAPQARQVLMRWFAIPSVQSAEKSDCSKLMPPPDKAGELVNQLGSTTLSTQLAARRCFAACAACCVNLLAEAVKSPASGLGRHHAIMIANLAAVIRDYEARQVALPEPLYADFGLTNYNLRQFREAATYLGRLSRSFLDARPQYYFYRGYARAESGQSESAVADYSAYLTKAPPQADRGTALYNLAMIYFRGGLSAERDGSAAEAASNFTLASRNFASAAQAGYPVAESLRASAAAGISRNRPANGR